MIRYFEPFPVLKMPNEASITRYVKPSTMSRRKLINTFFSYTRLVYYFGKKHTKNEKNTNLKPK
jgi:hypothetical protein